MLKKYDLQPGHFYRSPSEGVKDNKDIWYIFIYITNDNYQDWVGRYGESDNVGNVNDVYNNDRGSRIYEELSTTLPVFSKIGQYVMKRTFL